MSSFPPIDRKYLVRWWVILLLIIILQVWLSRLIWEETIRWWVDSVGIWAPLALIAYKTFSVVIAPLSGSVMYLVAWGLFGVRWWVLYGAVGNFLGMTLAYWIWRQYGDDAVRRLVGASASRQIEWLIDRLQDRKTFVITRIVLLPLEDLINFASGMARVPYWWFIGVSMVIVTVLSLVVVYFGDLIV